MDSFDQRRALAEDPDTPADVLARLAEDPDEIVRRSVAWNRSTPPEVLVRLAGDNDIITKGNAIQNPKLPRDMLIQLTARPILRGWAARNPSLPPEILAQLADDISGWVLSGVAQNPNTPPEVLARLANSSDWGVLCEVARNPNTLPDVLARLAAIYTLEASVARNPSTPPETLARLANDSSRTVREEVAGNPNTPLDVLMRLTDDPVPEVRKAVALNPNVTIEVLIRLTKVVIVIFETGWYKDIKWEHVTTKAVQTLVPGIDQWVTIFTDDNLKARPVHPVLVQYQLPRGCIAHEQGIIAIKGLMGDPINEPISKDRFEQLILAVQFATPEIPQPLMIPIKSEGIEFVEEPVPVPVASEGNQLLKESSPEAKLLGTVRLIALTSPFDVFNGQAGFLSFRLKGTGLTRFVFGDPIPVTPEIKQKLRAVPKLSKDRVPGSSVPHVETNDSYIYALWYPFEAWEYKIQ